MITFNEDSRVKIPARLHLTHICMLSGDLEAACMRDGARDGEVESMCD